MADPTNMWGAVSSLAALAAVEIAVISARISLNSLELTKKSLEEVQKR